METKTIFKEGDKVYVYPFGWGEFKQYRKDTDFADVQFDATGPICCMVKLVSFEIYTLNGFSQERPKGVLENRWYKLKTKTGGYLFSPRFGTNNKGFCNITYEWIEDYTIVGSRLDEWQLIDDSNGDELKELLKKEAIRRGYKEGVKLKQSGINSEILNAGRFSISGVFDFWDDLTTIDSHNGAGYIFKNGEWAEIEQPFLYVGKTATAEIDGKKFKINIIEEVK